MKSTVANILRRRHLVRALTVSNLKHTHRNTVLGSFWWLLEPIMMTAVYTIVIGVVLQRGGIQVHQPARRHELHVRQGDALLRDGLTAQERLHRFENQRRGQEQRIAVAGTLEDHDEWGAFLQGQFGDAKTLGRATRPDRAAEHTEIFGTREDRPAIDLAASTDETFCRNTRDGADQLSDLAKRIRVEEGGQALASIELAAIVQVLLDAIDSTHRRHAVPPTLQFSLNRRPRRPILLGRLFAPGLSLTRLAAARGPVVQIEIS